MGCTVVYYTFGVDGEMKYECHVTVDYPKDRVRLESIGQVFSWKTSYIDGDPVLGEKRFFYFTRHSNELSDLHDEMAALEQALPVPVVRKKIEETIYDELVVDSAPTLRLLQKACWQTADDHGFHDVGQTVGDKLMLIVSEAAEALEAFRDGKQPGETWYENETKPCGIPSELADIVIRVLDMAECYSIDLEKIMVEKMRYNESRPMLHGRTF